MDKANNEAKLIAENPDLVPASKAGKLSGCTLAAENVRRELARAFPGVKFSVRSKRFAGGDEVTVKWEDGPAAEKVRGVVLKYRPYGADETGEFWDYKPERAGWAKVFGETRFATVSRHWSEGTERALVSYFENHPVDTDDYHWQFEFRAWRLFEKTDIPANANVTGVQRDGDDWRITYTLPAPAPAPTSAPAPTNAPTNTPTTAPTPSFQVTRDGDWTWISFPTKPPASVLAAVRALGARWSAKRAAWYITRPVDASGIKQALLGA